MPYRIITRKIPTSKWNDPKTWGTTKTEYKRVWNMTARLDSGEIDLFMRDQFNDASDWQTEEPCESTMLPIDKLSKLNSIMPGTAKRLYEEMVQQGRNYKDWSNFWLK